MIHKSIYSFQPLFMQKNKEKDVKRYFFEILTLDHDRRKGFLRPEISKTSVPAIFDYT